MKKVLVVLLALSLILSESMVFAGKSYSSGGSSRSSGSSSGRSYSSGGSSSGRSYSSGGSSSRSSGSSGSSSSRSYTPSKPSYSPPTSPSKSYAAPSKPAYTPPSSTGKSYSSGSGTAKPYTPSYTPKAVPAAPTPPTGKSYSSGTASIPKNDFSGGSSTSGQPPPNSKKPASSTFNSGLSKSAKQEDSSVRYQAATAPKSTYKTPTGQTQTIKPNSPQVQTVRNYVTHERYVTYDNRASGFYGGYYGHPVYYNDHFSPFLWGWIMSDAMNSHQRAIWMYNHQSDMDSSRYQAMLAKDASLQAEINALKAQNAVRDPSYVPPQMQDNPDVMFNKEFVEASYNPVATAPKSTWFGFLFWTVTILTVGGILVYFMFFREY